MFGFGGEKARLTQLAERLAPTAFLQALGLDKAMMERAEEEGVDYHPMRPERLACFTIGAVGIAMLTSGESGDVVGQLGVKRFGDAVDRGRAAVQGVKTVPAFHVLFSKDAFEKQLMNVQRWFVECESHGVTSSAEIVGTWIWFSIRDAEPDKLAAQFQALGKAIVAMFGAYWLTEEEICRRRRGPRGGC